MNKFNHLLIQLRWYMPGIYQGNHARQLLALRKVLLNHGPPLFAVLLGSPGIPITRNIHKIKLMLNIIEV